MRCSGHRLLRIEVGKDLSRSFVECFFAECFGNGLRVFQELQEG